MINLMIYHVYLLKMDELLWMVAPGLHQPMLQKSLKEWTVYRRVISHRRFFLIERFGFVKTWHPQMQWFKPHVLFYLAIDLFQVSNPHHIKSVLNIPSKSQEISALYPHQTSIESP